MKKLLGLALLLAALTSHAGSTRTIDTSNTDGVFSGQNLLSNSGWERGTKGWTASAGTYTTTTTSPARGSAMGTWDASATSQTLTSTAVTIPDGMKGRNGAASILLKCASGTCSHTLTVYDGTNNIVTPVTITSSTSTFVRTSINFIYPTSGTVALRLTSAADEPLLSHDDSYLGLAEGFNISSISQASFAGAVTFPVAASCNWTRTSNASFASYSADSDCTLPTGTNIEGQADAPSTKIPAIKLLNVTPGAKYRFAAIGAFSSGTNGMGCAYKFTDGTVSSMNSVIHYVSGSVVTGGSHLEGDLTFTTGGDKTVEIQGTGAYGNTICQISVGGSMEGFRIAAYKFPTVADTAYSSAQQLLPTVTKITATGTYTTPKGVSYIRVRAVGGGGGGGGSGTTGGSAGGAGGDTTFGSSLLTANGGAGGYHGGGVGSGGGGAGGSGTVSSPAQGSVVPGNGGGSSSGTSNAGGNNFAASGAGGGSALFGGGARVATYGVAGVAGATNSGGGGSGGAGTSTASVIGGYGGGGGGGVEAIITAPAATYSVTIGAAGSAGSAGTSGFAGGAGGSGYVEVTEYYGSNPYPLLVGSVTSNTSGLERVERATIAEGSNCTTGACTISRQSGTWLTSATWSATGTYDLVFAAGIFSGAPTCYAAHWNGYCLIGLSPFTSTAGKISCRDVASGNPAANTRDIHLICMGPR